MLVTQVQNFFGSEHDRVGSIEKQLFIGRRLSTGFTACDGLQKVIKHLDMQF